MPPAPPPSVLRIDAARVLDALTTDHHAPATSLLLELGEHSSSSGFLPTGCIHARTRVLARGTTAEVNAHPAARAAQALALPDHVVLPAFVNAHTHLDLTHIGPRPPDPALPFPAFVDLVRNERLDSPDTIAASVRLGVHASLRGGVAAVGDIAGAVLGRASPHAALALAASPVWGVSYVEFFAVGASAGRALPALDAALHDAAPAFTSSRLRLGVQPHAPYSVGREGYRHAWRIAAQHDLPFATHLAETAAEREFIARGEGHFRDFLASLGLWDDLARADVGHGLSPVQHLARTLPPPQRGDPPRLAAHVNDLGPGDLQALRDAGLAVAYCPRASDYFGVAASLGPHPYRTLLDAGVPVALGTDSIINLPGGTSTLSTLDEARYLHARDGTDPMLLLRMATLHGAAALGLDTSRVLLAQGAEPAGIIAVRAPSLYGVFEGVAPPTLLVLGK
jgi:cytosine/adenosine deaminase-related metal-dependent hydrolase